MFQVETPISMMMSHMPMPGHYSMPKTTSPTRRSSPMRCMVEPSDKIPMEAVCKKMPFPLTADPEQSFEEQVACGQSMRWYGPMLCVTNWNDAGLKHGKEVYMLCEKDAEPRLMYEQFWVDDHCEGGLLAFNLAGIDMRRCKLDSSFREARLMGKTVEWLPNDVLRICHWQRVSPNKDDQRRQRHGPDRFYCVYPERPPLLLREQTWRCGQLDGVEVHYVDEDPMCWSSSRGREVLRRHWSAGLCDGLEVVIDPKTNARVERYWQQGRLHGPEIRRYGNSRTQLEACWDNGSLSGSWTLFYKNGNMCQSGMMMNGRRQGVWTRCDRQGRVQSTVNYMQGRQWGPQKQRCGSSWHSCVMNQSELMRQRREAMMRERNKLMERLATAEPCDRQACERKLARLQARLQ